MSVVTRVAVGLVIVAALADIAWVTRSFLALPSGRTGDEVARAIIDDATRSRLEAAEINDATLPRVDVDNAKMTLAFVNDARILPAYTGGQFVGLKAFSVRKNGLYERMGLENGDIVVSVNGVPVGPPSNDIERAARTESRFMLEVLNRGEARRIAVAIDPDAASKVEEVLPQETIVVTQADVDAALNNLSELSNQARIVPAVEGGKTIGFKLFSIQSGSMYERIGLQNGDIITHINEMSIASLVEGQQIYEKLKTAKEVLVDIQRRASGMRMHYRIE
jgi:type II secretory pathway component PulC